MDTSINLSELPDDQLLPGKEVCKILDLAKGTLANWACMGKLDLPYIKVGTLRNYRVGDILAYMSQHRVGE